MTTYTRNLDALNRLLRSRVPVSVSETLTGTLPAYADGEVIGGLVEVPGAALEAGGSGVFDRAWLDCASAQATEPLLQLIVFNAEPTNSTITDSAAFVLGAADVAKRVAIVPLAQWRVPAAAASAKGVVGANPAELGWSYNLPAGETSLWLLVVAKAAITLGAVDALTLNATVLPN